MIRRVLPLVITFALSLAPILEVRAQISDAEIDELLVLGKTNKFNKLVYECTAKRMPAALAFGVVGMIAEKSMNNGKTAYRVSMMSNRGYIARQAWDAARANTPFAPVDVKSEWREPALYVLVSPELPSERSKDGPPPPGRITEVLFRNFPSKAVQLTKAGEFVTVPKVWRNAAGATLEYVDTLAIYDAQRVGRLVRFEGDSRDGGLDLVVATDAGERTCVAVNVDRIKDLLKVKK